MVPILPGFGAVFFASAMVIGQVRVGARSSNGHGAILHMKFGAGRGDARARRMSTS
jgi:hypothetical protein